MATGYNHFGGRAPERALVAHSWPTSLRDALEKVCEPTKDEAKRYSEEARQVLGYAKHIAPEAGLRDIAGAAGKIVHPNNKVAAKEAARVARARFEFFVNTAASDESDDTDTAPEAERSSSVRQGRKDDLER